MISLKQQPWFQSPALTRILVLLNRDGAEARIVGGAVRNALMGLPVADMDIATTLKPEEVMERARQEGIKVVPTGLAHGTVTLVLDGVPFEVTTLRRDVATDGRHAEVLFTDDWKADAERRDLTINALYADASGEVHDDVGGLADIKSRTIRFIGDATKRIEEDYLRILRFFRFFAHYGNGRPDADGLRACASARAKLHSLSAERVWAELKKLLAADNPGRALLWMRTTGVLSEVLPETEKWGIDSIPGLVATEQALGWMPDPLLRLAAIIPPDEARVTRMVERLRLSKVEASFFAAWAKAPEINEDMAGASLNRLLYTEGCDGIVARIRLKLANQREKDQNIDRLRALLDIAQHWQKPDFPVKGADLLALGIPAGPLLGQKLAELESRWVEQDFKPKKEELLALI